MENSGTDPKHRNCGRCGEPVRRGSDFLRAQRWSTVVLLHWNCFIQQMRESDQRNANVSASAER
jgi:hypothetical protein